ncbi:MAG TPA: hypothetical protein VGC45_07585 [Gryllotalpicola sp.]
MTSNLDITAETRLERARRRSYRLHIGLAMLAYLAVLAVGLIWGHLDGTSPWRFTFALAPVAPAAWMAAAAIRRFRQLDEYQLKIAFPGIAAGFTVGMLAAVTVGFLGIAGLAVPFPAWIVFTTAMMTWWITNRLTGAAKQF